MKSLEDRVQHFGSPVLMLRNSPSGKYQFPVAPEFTNWIEEQRAWREGVALMDQSFHMTSIYVRGPDALKLLTRLGVNSFANFGRNKAKQLVCCNDDGYLISDAMLFGLEDDEFNIVGRPVLPNWVQFHAETGGYKVTIERDERSLDNPSSTRKIYRFEVQGPHAMKVLEQVNRGGSLSTKFFSMGEIVIAGCKARTLAHGMGGVEGLELWGPMADAATVRGALEEAGRQYGIREIGSKAYSTSSVESGWVPSPLPAIYTGEKMKSYREWLPARSFEGMSSLGGSLMSNNIEDYYFTPWDLDYGRHIKFDHEFIGREALASMVNKPHRRKVTLVWDKEDVLKVFAGMMEPGEMPKFMDAPAAYYASFPFDRVLSDGEDVGVSISPAYSANERAWLSLAVVREEVSVTGTQVSLLWGEPDAGMKPAGVKPNVERHRQIAVRATVQPWPINEAARVNYRSRK
jgi:vanillate/3-O-methylgallate O-demethylase